MSTVGDCRSIPISQSTQCQSVCWSLDNLSLFFCSSKCRITGSLSTSCFTLRWLFRQTSFCLKTSSIFLILWRYSWYFFFVGIHSFPIVWFLFYCRTFYLLSLDVFFQKPVFIVCLHFFFVDLKFFLLRYIYLFLFIVEILFSKYYSFFFIIKILLEYFLWCFCISFSTDGISSLTSFFFYLLKFLFLQNYLPWKVTVSVGRIVPLNLSRAKIAFLNVKIFLSPNCFTEYILWGYMYYHEATNYFSSMIIKRDIIHEIITIRISTVIEKTLIIFGK